MGYHGYSKSHRATAAETEGKYPASRLARLLKVRTGAVVAIMQPSEWHHTSSHYNATDYYDGAVLLDVASGNTGGLGPEEITEANELLDQLRAWRPPPATERTWEGCTVCWLEWSGTRRHPHAEACLACGVTVTYKGGAYLHMTGGTGDPPKRKKMGTRGFRVLDADGHPIADDYSTKPLVDDA